MTRAVIIGVGNRLRGDDAVGCLLIDELAGMSGATLFDTGSTPENYLEPVARLKPGRVLIADACSFGGNPGEYRLFGRATVEELSSGLLSTHTLPLSLTIEMLGRETGAGISLLGVQPLQLEFGTDLSQPVRAALPGLAEFCRRWVASA